MYGSIPASPLQRKNNEMQEGFLFDSDDPKEKGFGCDSLRANSDQLKFKWEWSEFGKGKPCQVSKAELENGWNLETVFWHTYGVCQ